MSTWELLNEKKEELGPSLRRAFWLPLRRMLGMFHILPVIAALVLFVLLATDGQLREIYVSYLEDTASSDFATFATTVIRFAAAAAGFALISAVLYEAHYLLSTVRINVIYSNNADLGTGSRLRHVQEVAAIVLALSPWLGLVTGLLHAKIYLANLFATLQEAGAEGLDQMQHVPMPRPWAIVAAVLVLGLVMSYFVAANPKSRTLQRSVIIVTPPAAVLLFLLLTDPPQFNPSLPQIVGICLSIAGIIAAYYVVYARLYTMRALVFSRSLQRDTGINLRKHQRLLLFIWALLPWVAAIALYFTVAPPADKNGLHSWAMIPVAMSWVISIGLLVASLLHRYRETPALKWSSYGAVVSLAVAGLFVSWLPPDIIVTVYRLLGPLGSTALALLFLISIFALLAVLSQQSGFPALTLVILALVGSVLVPIPIGWTVGLLAILCFAVFVMAAVSRLWAVASVAMILAVTGGINFAKMHGMKEVYLRTTADGEKLEQQFNSWLDHTKMAAGNSNAGGGTAAAQAACSARYVDKSEQYPVFIVAVEGGGIYAASAASMLLARLQDRDPCFSQHVFAISAVSGGAIGATIFQAIDQARLDEVPAAAASPATISTIANNAGAASTPPADPSNGSVPRPCENDQLTANHSLEKEVCEIIEDDHFSPLVASIFPELLGFTHSGRAQELATSFQQSVKMRDPAAAAALNDTFDDFAEHWSERSKAPALVLNATWVENGFRAAFAPFPLHAIDGSLYSFADKNMPDDRDLTLIKAAVVSARFPAVLPPYSLTIRRKPQSAEKSGNQSTGRSADNSRDTVRWNFVDGGYSDTSGAATALALYKALKAPAKARKVVLRVILLTNSDPQLEPNDINGTAFADTLAPIDAMLSVRNGLGNEAVERACDGILADSASSANSENTCENLTSKSDSPLQIVGIEDQTYGLSLGWKISQTSFGVVSWMLGQPEFVSKKVCQGQPANDPKPNSQSNGQFTLNEKVVCGNSRVLQDILHSLEPAGQNP